MMIVDISGMLVIIYLRFICGCCKFSGFFSYITYIQYDCLTSERLY